MSQPQPQPCTSCSGNRGRVVDTSTVENGRTITRQNWQTCPACSGSGLHNGGR